MKIDLNKIDEGNFMVKPYIVVGEVVTLVQPNHIGAKWDKHNLIFRSSVWNAQGEPVSLSFPKFFNWGEHPELTPLPNSLKGCNLVEKIDGSTLIVSHYKGQPIIRTRGTLDASGLPHNGQEIAYLMEKYPKILQHSKTNPFLNYIFEWVTTDTDAMIVIKHPEIDLYLTGIIDHNDYSLFPQQKLTWIANELGVKRPAYYEFFNIEQMLTYINGLKNKEGICVYYNNDQNILKIKSEWYLALHKFKENCHDEPIIDLFLEYGRPDYLTFLAQLEVCFDYECMNQARSIASRVCDAAKEVNKLVAHMNLFVQEVKKLPSRKDQALKIKSAYGETNRASFVFNLLDGRELDNKSYKKLLFQLLK